MLCTSELGRGRGGVGSRGKRAGGISQAPKGKFARRRGQPWRGRGAREDPTFHARAADLGGGRGTGCPTSQPAVPSLALQPSFTNPDPTVDPLRGLLGATQRGASPPRHQVVPGGVPRNPRGERLPQSICCKLFPTPLPAKRGNNCLLTL